jgi:plastocyanin
MNTFVYFPRLRWLCLLAAAAGAAVVQAAGPMAGPRMSPGGMAGMFGVQAPGAMSVPLMSRGCMAGFQPMTAASRAYASGGYGGGGGMQGYGQGYGGGMQGYGQGYGVGRGLMAASEDYAARFQPSAAEISMSRVLTASGVPNENGRPRWPLGLQVLASPGTDERDLRDQIDQLLGEAADQGASGPVNPNLVQELNRAVGEFRRLMQQDRPDRYVIPRADWADSERFLNRLEHAGKVLEAGLATPAGQGRLRAQEGAAVGLHDNYFEPQTITVPAGATVWWVNRGQHQHSVTADDMAWGSDALGPQEGSRYTFTRSGTYPYHCAMHPSEMRGVVFVK